MHNKKAFSLVEIIIVVAIIGLLGVIGYSINSASQTKSQSGKVVADIETLNNSFLQYKNENSMLPNPTGNINYFGSGSEYLHIDVADRDDTSKSFGKYGLVTQDLLPKKYLNYLPLDPKTNQYYSYGKTTDSQFFEVAGVIYASGDPLAKVTGNYPGDSGPYNLIREYNGPDFISDGSKNSLPFNPEERLLIANIHSFTGNVSITNSTNTQTITSEDAVLAHTLVEGDTITVSQNGEALIYYSDGSQSTLGDTGADSILTLANMEFITEDNLLTRIQVALDSGTLWTKATSLNDDGSEFEVYTQDTSASVRGTIFGVKAGPLVNTIITVTAGSVEIKKTPSDSTLVTIIDEIKNQTIQPRLTQLENLISNGTNTVSYNGTLKQTTTSHLSNPPVEIINNNEQIQINSVQIDVTGSIQLTASVELTIPEKHSANSDTLLIESSGSYYYSRALSSLIQNDTLLSLTDSLDFSKLTTNSAKEFSTDAKNNFILKPVTLSGGNSTPFSTIVTNADSIKIALCKYNGSSLSCVSSREISTKENKVSYVATKEKDTAPVPIVIASVDPEKVTTKIPPVVQDCSAGLAVSGYTLDSALSHNNIGTATKSTNLYNYDRTLVTASKTTSVQVTCNNAQLSISGGPSEEVVCKTSTNTSTAYSKFTADLDGDGVNEVYCEETVDGKSLYAFAPYDRAGDLDLYKNDGNKNIPSHDAILTNTYNFNSSCDSKYDEFNSFCEIDGDTGIFVDNTGNDDFIKYSGLNLGNDFVIEMSVRGEDLKRSSEYTLFNIPGVTRLFSRKYSGQPLSFFLHKDWYNYKQYDISLIQNQNNQKVQIYSNNLIYINESPLNLHGTKGTLPNLLNDIYIGSSSNQTKQWDGIINYFKIYK